MTMKKIVFLSILLCCITGLGFSQNSIKDGLMIWTSDWDSYSPDSGYFIRQWKYDAKTTFWSYVDQQVVEPMIEGYGDKIFDMGMDMIYLKGRTDVDAFLTVSMGSAHFPSLGTEIQHRRLNAKGEWELVQPALQTIDANISTLGLSVYYAGSDLHLAWTEDSDDTSICTIYDQAYTVGSDGKLTAKGDKVKVFTQTLNWSGTHGGLGGISGLSACDFNGDGKIDFMVGEMFYKDDTAGASAQLILGTDTNKWATKTTELWYGQPGHGAEGLRYCDVDGDKTFDAIITSGSALPWGTIVWLKKNGNILEEQEPILDCDAEVKLIDSSYSVGHIFGLSAATTVTITTAVQDWSIF